MSTQIQLRKGTSTEHQSFTGAVGEVTYVTDTHMIRVHDGVTVGGFELGTQGTTDKDFSIKNISVSGTLVPTMSATCNIGSSTQRFGTLYVDEMKLSPNTLYIGDTPIIGTSQSTVQIHANVDQSISVLTAGSGQTTISSGNKVQISTSGMNADAVIQASGTGSKVRISATQAVDVNVDTNMQKNVAVTGDVTVAGNLAVSGTTVTVNTGNLLVKDNLIDVNSGETGTGVSAGTAGMRVRRGTSTDMLMVFDESDDLFKVGAAGSFETIATREWFTANNTVSWSNITGKPTFATVATSGSYTDLTNKPSLATVATSGSYDDLTNKPTIPTTLSQLTNDLPASVSTGMLYGDIAAALRVQGTTQPYSLLVDGVADGLNTFGGVTLDGLCTISGTTGFVTNELGEDPFWENVTCLLHFDNNLNDISGNNLSFTSSGVTFDNAVKKIGEYSAKFDGVNSSHITATTPGTSTLFVDDFTIEMWFNPTNFSVQRSLVETRKSGGSGGVYVYTATTTGYLALNANNVVTNSTVSPIAGQWNHIAIQRSGSIMSVWLNGVSVITYTTSTSYPDSYLRLGNEMSLTQPFLGYIDEFKITNGVARYTSKFTPRSTAFTHTTETASVDPVWNNVTTLLPLDANINDTSGNALAMTNYGAVSFIQPKTGTGCAYFNGSSSFLNVASPGNATKFAGDFTIEAWVNLKAVTSLYQVVVSTTAVSGGSDTTGVTIFTGYNDKKVKVYMGTSVVITSTADVTLGGWTHVAVVRTGSTVTLFVDGVAQSQTYTTSTNYSSGALYIGKAVWGDFFGGMIDNLHIVNGTALYTSNFTPSTQTPTKVANTTALFSFDGNITDSSVNALVATNTSVLLPTTKFGSSTSFFNGSSTAYLNASSPGNASKFYGDFTVEMWVNALAAPSNNVGLFETRTNATGSANGWFIRLFSTGFLNFGGFFAGTSGGVSDNVSIVGAGWTHIAMSRIGSTLYAFKNGVLLGTATLSNVGTDGGIYIGKCVDAGSVWLTGQISNFRITNGFGRYTSNFSVPTAAFSTNAISQYDPFWSNTPLMMHCDDATNAGNSSITFTNFVNSGATYSTSKKKFGTASMYFDGTGKLKSTSTATNAGTSDFTLEFWMLSEKTINENNYVIDFRPSGTTGGHQIYVAGSDKRVGAAASGYSTAWGPSITPNTWAHVAIVRSAGYVTVFVNGIPGTPVSSPIDVNGGAVILGGDFQSTATTSGFIGGVDELRYTIGVARYTANFAVPSSPFLTYGTVGGTGSITSIPYTATTVPSKIAGLITIEDVNNAGVATTDLALKVSRDGGTTWTAGTLSEYGYVDSTTRAMVANVDVSGQPSGSTIKYKVEANTTKKLRVHAAGLRWS